MHERSKWHTLILTGIILLSLAIRMSALFIPHIENDEVIYQTLAEKISKNPLDYTLRGTFILHQLPANIYDHPLFCHPPFFIWLLALVKIVLGIRAEVLVSIVMGVLTILITYFIGKQLYSKKHGLLAAIILACCPVMLFVSTKIWLEIGLTLFVTLSFYLVILACHKKSILWFTAAGVVFGMGLLVKHSAILIAPAVLYFIYRHAISWKQRVGFIAVFFLTGVCVNIPWLVYYRLTSGTFFYASRYASSYNIASIFPFVVLAANRPWHYYFSGLISVYPVYLFCVIALTDIIRKKGDLSMALWALSFMIIFTILALKDRNVQVIFALRFLAPALPALAILASYGIYPWIFFVKPAGRTITTVFLIFFSYGLFMGIMNMHRPDGDIVQMGFFLYNLFTSLRVPPVPGITLTAP